MSEQKIIGRKFIHSFWLDDLHTKRPTECVITDESDKEIFFEATSPLDRRKSRCKKFEFWNFFRQWSDDVGGMSASG